MVNGPRLLYVDGRAREVYRREGHRWAPVAPAGIPGKVPELSAGDGWPALWAMAQDSDGTLLVYTMDGERRPSTDQSRTSPRVYAVSIRPGQRY